jgi:hypothetical protein
LTDEEQFKEGQKLEAVDPLDMSRVCPATIVKVIRKKFDHFNSHADDRQLDPQRWIFYAFDR